MSNDAQTYTWSQFTAAVLALLPVESQRIGPVQPYIQLLIRQGVIECEQMIPWLRTGHETLYQASDFIGEGWASNAALPPQARVRDAFIVEYDTILCGPPATNPPTVPTPLPVLTPQRHCRRYKLEDWPWENRMGLINAGVAVNGNIPRICFNAQAETFYVYPCLRDCQNVSLFWDGLKINFQPNEMTPFNEPMTLVIADYVKSKTSREIDKDLPLAGSYEESYRKGRRLLFLDMKDRTQTNDEIT
jgi:hypothetical protein